MSSLLPHPQASQIFGTETWVTLTWLSKSSAYTPPKILNRQRRWANNHHASSAHKSFQILWKRVPVWTRLSHPNILPFRGVDMVLFPLSLVYDWGENDNITQYISSHPRASRPLLVRKPRHHHNQRYILTLYSLDRWTVAWCSEGTGIPP